ncbi:MAG: hypothetical protein ABWX92_09900 [Mycetocola sp.]
MATLAINRENIEELKGDRSTKDFAAEVGVDPATMSRLLGGKAVPGDKVIAGFLTTYPHQFDHFFCVVDDNTTDAA